MTKNKQQIEALAELEHNQWIAWSKNIAETETITPARLERWKILWRPYSELTEAEKDQDREWAIQAYNIVEPLDILTELSSQVNIQCQKCTAILGVEFNQDHKNFIKGKEQMCVQFLTLLKETMDKLK